MKNKKLLDKFANLIENFNLCKKDNAVWEFSNRELNLLYKVFDRLESYDSALQQLKENTRYYELK